MLGFLALTGAILVLAVREGASRQRSAASAQMHRLIQSSTPAADASGPASLAGVPPPVARYLRLALPEGNYLGRVRLRQAGTLRTDVNSDRWMLFEAEHVVVPPATGFVWNARVMVAPLIHVRVRDALIAGRGSGHVSLFSTFTVSAAADAAEINSGSLHRYLAEAVWYPTALLPSSELTWSEIDDRRALATLTSHGVSVSLEFRFARSGEVTGIYTPARWGSFPGGYRQAPWEGHFRGYRERDGVVVPGEGDVGWYVHDEWRAVWRGRITHYQTEPDAR